MDVPGGNNKTNFSHMKKTVIIVAGGSGTRMGSEIPKQFLLLEDLPVLMQTIDTFLRYEPSIQIIVVLPETERQYWADLCIKHNFNHPHQVVKGGETRFHSVKNGLDAMGETDLVAVHDGVRPLVSRTTIDNCFKQAAKTGSAIPVLPMDETLRKGSAEHSRTVDRTLYFTVQTPQVFQTSIISDAYTQEWSPAFTDDASVAEKKGFHVTMVPGNPENIKITRQGDLLVAKAFLKKKEDIL
jgi:2-C-methyl-D-erythritol 4-phosphate cytidylyltransferase